MDDFLLKNGRLFLQFEVFSESCRAVFEKVPPSGLVDRNVRSVHSLQNTNPSLLTIIIIIMWFTQNHYYQHNVIQHRYPIYFQYSVMNLQTQLKSTYNLVFNSFQYQYPRMADVLNCDYRFVPDALVDHSGNTPDEPVSTHAIPSQCDSREILRDCEISRRRPRSSKRSASQGSFGCRRGRCRWAVKGCVRTSRNGSRR